MVIKDLGKRWSNGRTRRFWMCICVCGKSVEVCADSLGAVKSCGCLNHLGTHCIIHGKTGTKEFNTWTRIKQRCYNPSNKSYKDYGFKGITVCDAWKNSYESFILDMGESPSPDYTLDRINSNGNYEPTNCRWATMKQQQNNRTNNVRFEHKGVSKTVAEWAETLGFTYNRMYKLLKVHGKTVDEVISKGLK